jgi:Thioredoxin-like
MCFRSFVGLLICALAPLQGQDAPFRLVPRQPEPEKAAGPTWLDSFALAEAAAKERHGNLLLYFTAKWCGPCQRMERETFPQPEVREALAKLAIARIDIDSAANVEVCRRWHGHEGVPTFVLIDAEGTELHRWVGSSDAKGFLDGLKKGADVAANAEEGALEHHAALAAFYLQRNDQERAAEQLRAIERLDPGHRAPALENTLWSACSVARQRRDWAALRAAAGRYLELPAPAHGEQARALLGVAEFETAGTMTPALQAYVDERVTVITTPWPGSTLLDKMDKFLGKEPDLTGGDARVERVNTAIHELVDVGGAAAPALRHALLHKQGEGLWPAIVLARLRLPESTPWLTERLDDPATPAWARRWLVMSIAEHKEDRCLPVLLEWAGEKHLPVERSDAVEGIRDLLFRGGTPASPEVARVLAAALESRDRRLLANVLQALFCAHAPMPLERLLELLDDQRSLGWGDYHICDNALWILLDQLGMQLERSDGKPQGEHCSREIAAWMRGWYARNAAALRWDATANCYCITR